MKFQLRTLSHKIWQFDDKYYFKYWDYGPTLQVFPSEQSFKKIISSTSPTKLATDNDMQRFIKLIFSVNQIVDQSWV